MLVIKFTQTDQVPSNCKLHVFTLYQQEVSYCHHSVNVITLSQSFSSTALSQIFSRLMSCAANSDFPRPCVKRSNLASAKCRSTLLTTTSDAQVTSSGWTTVHTTTEKTATKTMERASFAIRCPSMQKVLTAVLQSYNVGTAHWITDNFTNWLM